MIFQSTYVFVDNDPINFIDLLGTDQIENFTARKIVGEGSFYIGNENVSPISFGFKIDNPDAVYFPKIDLQINPNLYICGDVGVTISILAWQ
jgi:hypothetical protein